MLTTGRYELARTLTGWEVVFFCDLCGGAVRVKVRGWMARQEALEKGWALARPRLHRCGNCGRWHCAHCHDPASRLCGDCGRITGFQFEGIVFWQDHIKSPLTTLFISLQKLEMAIGEGQGAELVEAAMRDHQKLTHRIDELLSAVREDREERNTKEETTP